MTIFSDYQKYKTEKLIQKNKLQKDYLDNQNRKLEMNTRTQSGIPDMSEQLKKVRKNKSTLSRDYLRLTSSELNVYYGHSSENLDDDLACDILEWMVKYGADPNKPNSVGLTPLKAIEIPLTIYERVNNERFKQMLISYNNSTN